MYTWPKNRRYAQGRIQDELDSSRARHCDIRVIFMLGNTLRNTCCQETLWMQNVQLKNPYNEALNLRNLNKNTRKHYFSLQSSGKPQSTLPIKTVRTDLFAITNLIAFFLRHRLAYGIITALVIFSAIRFLRSALSGPPAGVIYFLPFLSAHEAKAFTADSAGRVFLFIFILFFFSVFTASPPTVHPSAGATRS